MALTLVVETGAGLASANSYCTLAEARAYLERHLYAAAWTDADEERQTAALIWATQLLDDHVEFVGEPATTTQVLSWPRDDVYDRHGNVVSASSVPTLVKNATAELARALLADNRADLADRGGVVSQSVGPLSVTYGAGGSARGMIPPTVWRMLAVYIAPRLAVRA